MASPIDRMQQCNDLTTKRRNDSMRKMLLCKLYIDVGFEMVSNGDEIYSDSNSDLAIGIE